MLSLDKFPGPNGSEFPEKSRLGFLAHPQVSALDCGNEDILSQNLFSIHRLFVLYLKLVALLSKITRIQVMNHDLCCQFAAEPHRPGHGFRSDSEPMNLNHSIGAHQSNANCVWASVD